MTTPQQIDFMWDEMRANLDARPLESGEFAAGFSVGWRAALEAAHAKASAGGEGVRVKYWADKHKYWAWRGDRGVWIHINGDTELSDLTPLDWDDCLKRKSGFTPCTTEAEARRVAGFTEGSK